MRAQIFDRRFEQVFFVGAIEHGDLRAFASMSKSAAAVPLSPAPSTATFLSWYSRSYLNFSVASPSSAKMADRIQNRTMTVFSFQPVSSK